ncbi:MAG: YchJ family metal-binding protein [Campylobacterota bacterium]|nr:YchJ family metal-binding protein [Campylobacterota bacterium]
MKITVNAKCPCQSGKKYKHCCMLFHKGAIAKTALELMRSRYSAYAANDYKYIIKTTHTQNPDFTLDDKMWGESILEFSRSSEFHNLNILEFIEGSEEAYVTFEAVISQDLNDATFTEKSKFLKDKGRWFYHSGKMYNN